MHPFVKQYQTVALPQLKEKFEYSSEYLIPKVEKVVINVGTGSLKENNKALEDVVANITAISGQKPVVTKARKAISGFKIRQDMEVGYKVTLRGARMNDFLIKLIQITLPRTRDFRGVRPSSIASNGSLHLGIRDCMIFPEISQDSTSHGLQVSLISTPCTAEEGRVLYEALGFVFQSNQ